MADNIQIQLPDGSVKELPKGSTALDVAKSIGQRLADAALVAKTNGDLIDLTRPLEIRRAIRTFQPAFIVNAAAYTAVDKAESEESLARTINAEAPAVMAEEAKKIGACLIHFSTD